MSSSQLTNSIIFQRGRLNHQPELVSRCALLTCRLVADVLVFPRMFDGEKHMPYTHTHTSSEGDLGRCWMVLHVKKPSQEVFGSPGIGKCVLLQDFQPESI